VRHEPDPQIVLETTTHDAPIVSFHVSPILPRESLSVYPIEHTMTDLRRITHARRHALTHRRLVPLLVGRSQIATLLFFLHPVYFFVLYKILLFCQYLTTTLCNNHRMLKMGREFFICGYICVFVFRDKDFFCAKI